MLLSRACFYCTRDSTIDMLRTGGRRSAMQRTHCAAMLKNKSEIGEFMFAVPHTNKLLCNMPALGNIMTMPPYGETMFQVSRVGYEV